MTDNASRDLVAKPLSFLTAWGIPLAVLVAANFLDGVVPFDLIVVMISGSFFWMGLACLANARRCRRRHCFYSGPILVAGGVAVLLVGFGIVFPGEAHLTIVVNATLAAALLTFLSEPIFGKYVS